MGALVFVVWLGAFFRAYHLCRLQGLGRFASFWEAFSWPWDVGVSIVDWAYT
jgi:hypothetical protein